MFTLKQIKEALKAKGADMSIFDLYFCEAYGFHLPSLEFYFRDVHNCCVEDDYRVGDDDGSHIVIVIDEKCTLDNLVSKAKDIIDSWRKIISVGYAHMR